ncbi:MAG: C4-dicarboxylate ABC transporter substrate-binding protein, partial [Roseovarius sp.]
LTEADADAAAKARDEMGVTFIEFGEEEADTFRGITREVWADWGAKSPNAQALVDSHMAFLGTLGLE